MSRIKIYCLLALEMDLHILHKCNLVWIHPFGSKIKEWVYVMYKLIPGKTSFFIFLLMPYFINM